MKGNAPVLPPLSLWKRIALYVATVVLTVYLAFGYRLEYLGRTNKKNQPVRDMVIDEAEAAVVREIYHLLTEEGYGTNRVAQYLNDRGIKTKKGKPNWRGTTIRSMVENPIYTGVLTFGDGWCADRNIASNRLTDNCQNSLRILVAESQNSGNSRDFFGFSENIMR